jgi:Tol biopolymer transport system component
MGELSISPSSNPYVGPRTFTAAEAELFFGREQEADQLLALVISERLILFYAQSGAGKSSLLQARLIPRLKVAGLYTLPVGRVSGQLPPGVGQANNIFSFNLMLSLDSGQGDPNRFSQVSLSHFLARLTSHDGRSFYYDEQAVPQAAAQAPDYVLIIDQFEEIITTHADRWTERADFFRQLDQAMADDPLLRVVLTLREDYVAALDPYSPLLAGKLRARFYMQRMGYPAALEAITRPAALYGRPFADGVAEMLVNNLRQIKVPDQNQVQLGQFVEPVQLQVVCYQLWENLKARPVAPVSADDLRELGNVDSALAEFYEQALRQAYLSVLVESDASGPPQAGTTVAPTVDTPSSVVSELELRAWFDQKLITEAGTRGTVYQGRHETAGMANAIVKRLADLYLLRAEIRAGGTWYELVHDRFIEPIQQANRAWRERRLQQSPLIQAAQAWADAGRPEARLYRDQPLRDALAGLQPQEQEPLVTEFLKASEEAQRRRELAAATRQAVVLRRSIGVLGLVLLLAIGAAIYALYQQGQAQANAQLAAAKAVEADTARSTAEARLAVAETAQAQAEVAQTRALAAQADAEARQAEAIAAQATAESEAASAAQAREDLVANLEAQLAAAQVTLTLTPTPAPLSTSSIAGGPTTTPTPSPVPMVYVAATATAEAVETVRAQLLQVLATQTTVARAVATPSAPPASFPPPGRIVFISNRGGQRSPWGDLYGMQGDGSNLYQLTFEMGNEPDYSAAADKIVYSKRRPGQRPEVSLYTIDPDGGAETNIDGFVDDNWEPAWSPDGQRIAFVSSRDNRDWEIYSMRLDGSEVEFLSDCGSLDPEWLKWGPAWSPVDGRIAFVVQYDKARQEDRGQSDIWIMNADGTECQPLTENGAGAGVMNKRPAWSPDGRQLAFVSNQAGEFELYLMDVATQRQRKIPSAPVGANYPDWSADGRWLVFSLSRPYTIMVMTVDGSFQKALTTDNTENWSPIWIP